MPVSLPIDTTCAFPDILAGYNATISAPHMVCAACRPDPCACARIPNMWLTRRCVSAGRVRPARSCTSPSRCLRARKFSPYSNTHTHATTTHTPIQPHQHPPMSTARDVPRCDGTQAPTGRQRLGRRVWVGLPDCGHGPHGWPKRKRVGHRPYTRTRGDVGAERGEGRLGRPRQDRTL